MHFLLLLVTLCVLAVSATPLPLKKKLLVFSKTDGYHHESIPAGNAAIQKLGAQNNFDVDLTTNSSLFLVANYLKQYSAVVWLDTTNNVLNNEEQRAFKLYYQSGNGFVGIHAAVDCEYDWPWYNKLIGGTLLSHPARLQNATLSVVDRSFIATKHLPKKWKLNDEWHNLEKTHFDKVNVLITIDEKEIIGGEEGKLHPISWYREFDGGRSFYTALSHSDEIYTNALYLQHLLGGIQYAMGVTI